MTIHEEFEKRNGEILRGLCQTESNATRLAYLALKQTLSEFLPRLSNWSIESHLETLQALKGKIDG